MWAALHSTVTNENFRAPVNLGVVAQRSGADELSHLLRRPAHQPHLQAQPLCERATLGAIDFSRCNQFKHSALRRKQRMKDANISRKLLEAGTIALTESLQLAAAGTDDVDSVLLQLRQGDQLSVQTCLIMIEPGACKCARNHWMAKLLVPILLSAWTLLAYKE